jgi:hypothetical protein
MEAVKSVLESPEMATGERFGTFIQKKGEGNMKVKIGWAKNKGDFIHSVSDGEWIITADNELMYVGINCIPEDVNVKHSFLIYGLAPHHTTDWLRFFCNKHHPDIDFDKEFETGEQGVFARYQEKFGYDYEEWVAEEKYMVLKEKLMTRGYELPWAQL